MSMAVREASYVAWKCSQQTALTKEKIFLDIFVTCYEVSEVVHQPRRQQSLLIIKGVKYLFEAFELRC
ncbi:unnamed protein product [Ilex paraguariensis]|uniref:Uncharacterized protein n=1 Tax=Ilex paraguariensis TaxID=185542 RepID=A0ABC8UFB7_9AQUA